MTRSYGWAKRGKPCVGRVPGNSGRRQSMVALFTPAGMVSHQMLAGSLRQADFAAFVEQKVVPFLSAGDVVVVDNARCHYSKAAKEAIESVGARLVFLPAYSPDFAPIELAWRQVKAFLRQAQARTLADLQAAMEPAMRQVTPANACTYFTHCGYRALQIQ